MKIFVGRLTEGCHKEDLLALFSKYGEVVECDVLTNFGFVVRLNSNNFGGAHAPVTHQFTSSPTLSPAHGKFG